MSRRKSQNNNNNSSLDTRKRTPGEAAVRDLQNTNSTLTSFLGGRQKSWMTAGGGAGDAVREQLLKGPVPRLARVGAVETEESRLVITSNTSTNNNIGALPSPAASRSPPTREQRLQVDVAPAAEVSREVETGKKRSAEEAAAVKAARRARKRSAAEQRPVVSSPMESPRLVPSPRAAPSSPQVASSPRIAPSPQAVASPRAAPSPQVALSPRSRITPVNAPVKMPPAFSRPVQQTAPNHIDLVQGEPLPPPQQQQSVAQTFQPQQQQQQQQQQQHQQASRPPRQALPAQVLHQGPSYLPHGVSQNAQSFPVSQPYLQRIQATYQPVQQPIQHQHQQHQQHQQVQQPVQQLQQFHQRALPPQIPPHQQQLSPANTPIQSPLQAPRTPSADQSRFTIDALDRLSRFLSKGPFSKNESRRLDLLRQAIVHNDWFFLVLHQAYTSSNLTLLGSPSHLKGWQLIINVLGPNDQVSQKCLEFFGSFPVLIGEDLARVPEMNNQISAAKLFLGRDYEKALSFLQGCVNLQRKASKEELESCLPFRSPVLRDCLLAKMAQTVNHAKTRALQQHEQQQRQLQMQQQQQQIDSEMSQAWQAHNQRAASNPIMPQGPMAQSPVPQSPQFAMPQSPVFPHQMPQHMQQQQMSPQMQQQMSPQLQQQQAQLQRRASNGWAVGIAPQNHNGHNQGYFDMAAPPPPQTVAFNSGPRFTPTNMVIPQHPGGSRQGAPQSPGFAMDQGYQYSTQLHRPNHVQQQAAPGAFTGIHQSHLPSNHTPPPTPSASTWSSSSFGPQLQQQQMAQVQQPAPQMSIPQSRHHGQQQQLHYQSSPSVQSALPSLPQSMMQMHLASPIIPSKSLPDVKDAPTARLHLVISDLVTPTLPLAPTIQTTTFDLPAPLHARLSRSELSPASQPIRPHLQPGSLIFRLRSTKTAPTHPTKPPTSTSASPWVTSDTAWPKNLFIELNSIRIDLRRKMQWGKDLPVDITNHILCGTNTLRTVCTSPDAPAFSLAVEMLQCMNEGSIISRVREVRTVPSNLSRSRITSRLHPDPPNNDDDDLIMQSANTAVSLKCPMSFAPMRIPVRTHACTHLDCFDLQNFLESRPKGKNGAPSCAEGYRCPICAADARPAQLLVDGFLEEVLTKAKEEEVGGLGRPSAVRVEKDGSWGIVREEDDEDGASRESSPEEKEEGKQIRATPVQGRAGGRREMEVICLDDSD